MSRAVKARVAADLLLVVLDGASPLTAEDRALLAETATRPRVVLVNKCDLQAAWTPLSHASPAVGEEWLAVSAARGDGLESLVRSIARNIDSTDSEEPPIISNLRHLGLLERAESTLGELLGDLTKQGHMPEELLLSRIAETSAILEELTGRRTSEDLLEEIFSKFCIGK